MDPVTAKLAVQLQLADIADLLNNLHYDGPNIFSGDPRRSFEVLRGDLEKQLQTLEGQILTLQILKEEHESRLAFSRLVVEERQATSDHRLAMRLEGLDQDDSGIESNDGYEASVCGEPDDATDTQWNMAKEAYATAFTRDAADIASRNNIQTATTTTFTVRPKPKILDSAALTKCVVCMEVVPSTDTITLNCKPEVHVYCRTCLVDLFKSALENTMLFPPRCCKLPIPFDICRAILPKQLVKDFDLKVEELATPNPTYCSNASCSKFVAPKDIKADVGKCVYCKEKTCVLCKCREHAELCPSDPHVQLLMDVAKRSKWQQCTKCKNMVELEVGCFHMTCRCGYQFCYLCGVKWKICSCPQWDENYLTRPRATVTIGQAATVIAPIPPHIHNWNRVDGQHCARCGAHWLPWVMRCDGCNTNNCWRCLHNL